MPGSFIPHLNSVGRGRLKVNIGMDLRWPFRKYCHNISEAMVKPFGGMR